MYSENDKEIPDLKLIYSSQNYWLLKARFAFVESNNLMPQLIQIGLEFWQDFTTSS